MTRLARRRAPGQSSFWLGACVIAAALVTLLLLQNEVTSASAGQAGTINTPQRVGGATADNETALDVNPSVAYDATSGRYLVVWTSARNAGSSSDGLDVIGMFLNNAGVPIGQEFRISDSNTASRNWLPAVAAGNGGFAVAWGVHGGWCQIDVQRVSDDSTRSDRLLVAGMGHSHSPSLVYNPARQQYTLAYVQGDDYLPPTLFGADTADCGNNAASTSGIRALEFFFSGDDPIPGSSVDVSGASAGAFRPRLAYSAALGTHLVMWEDRRNAGSQSGRFDVYGQRLSGGLSLIGSNMSFAVGGDYASEDSSSTWTALPVVAANGSGFLAAWFVQDIQGSARLRRVDGSFVPATGARGASFVLSRMTFAQSHSGNAPSGSLSLAHVDAAHEFMLGITSHLESVWGYLSTARVQRITDSGELLRMNGSLLSQPSVGTSIDYANDDQFGSGLALAPAPGSELSGCLAVYGKHALGRQSLDFDIWGARVQIPNEYSTPTVVATPIGGWPHRPPSAAHRESSLT